ncbi:MAG: stage 0 sporulation family protein [Acidobacteriota bacterium]
MRSYATAKLREDGVPLEFETGGVEVKPGDAVILMTDSGERFGTVGPDVPSSCGGCTGCAVKPKPIRLARPATTEDHKRNQEKLRQEGNAYRSCLMKIKERGLPMKLIRVEYETDTSGATFFFTADQRIDFRALVRALARELQTRIEMRQIGPRDAAGMLGGYGSCGRALCCSTFLKKFRPISIKMAKQQNLSLNPSKLTGQCGRLKCCLAYEYD